MQYSVKYRPSTFAQVVGQEVAVRILRNSILMNRVPSACLLNGIRGTGKTTLARIYAKALNCENFALTGDLCGTCPSCQESADSHPSIIERDAATYNGVDDVRDMEQLVNQVVIHRYKAIILDECHMFSKSAQAALLKMLEEPPPHVIFMLVTTDPQRLEDTIRSRCMQMPLKGLNPPEVAHNVRGILDSEGVSYTEEFVDSISRLGGGSMRDVQQILEGMVLAAGDATVDVSLLRDSVGVISAEEYGDLADVIDRGNLRYFLTEVRRWEAEGRDLKFLFNEGIPNMLRDFMIVLSGIPENDIFLLSGLKHSSIACNLTIGMDGVKRCLREWEVSEEFMRYSSDPRVIWSMYAAKVCSE